MTTKKKCRKIYRKEDFSIRVRRYAGSVCGSFCLYRGRVKYLESGGFNNVFIAEMEAIKLSGVLGIPLGKEIVVKDG